MKKQFVFTSLFILLSLLSYTLLSIEKDDKIEKHLHSKTVQYMQNYKVLYEENRNLSKLIFETKINRPNILNIFKKATSSIQEVKDEAREELYEKLQETYTILQEYNIKQLHFHLPNNESYLRFHRPKIFGDNLTSIRETINYVNKYKKPIDGFEEGRIYNGYRFVFPLFLEEVHLGSVEISFSTLAMSMEFMHDYAVISNFLILKSVIDAKVFESEKNNYIPSQIKDFYLEKAMLNKIQKNATILSKLPISDTTKAMITKHATDKESFSLYDSIRQKLITFIKVQNPVTKQVVGLFVVHSSNHYILNKNRNFYFILILINLFIGVVLFFFYKDSKYRQHIQESNLTLENRVKEEVDKNREKDRHMLTQSRLAQMGELISMIAHQWRQPLGVIAAISSNMQVKLEFQTFDYSNKEGIEKYNNFIYKELHNIDRQLQNLSTTLDEFKNFYKPTSNAISISFKDVMLSTLKIIKSSMIKENVSIIENYSREQELLLYSNEIMQVFLNILKNSKDNFEERNIINPEIRIDIKENKILISDNGGGINNDIIDQIFNPYFSTKTEKNGTGLGLYMSKMIIQEHHNGTITVHNTDCGVCFTIKIDT